MPETLLVDLGNTRLRWADPAGLERDEVGSATHGGGVDADLLEACWGERTPPARLVVANVAGPAAAESVTAWARRRWQLEPEFPTAGPAACGVRNGYTQPEHLGIDRFAALVGAFGAGIAPACVVDCGSAITVDLLAADGLHLGGYIAPGLTAMAQALQAAAPGLPGPDAPGDIGPGRETGTAIAGGIQLAAAGLVERARALAAEQLGPAPTCVVTGGDAARLAGALPGGCLQIPSLVLQGLRSLSEE